MRGRVLRRHGLRFAGVTSSSGMRAVPLAFIPELSQGYSAGTASASRLAATAMASVEGETP